MAEVVLVTGATGLIGHALVDSLRADGVPVRALSRNVEAASRALGPGVECLRWNGLRPPEGALADCSAVVHLAGEPIFKGRLTASRRRLVTTSRVASTELLTEAIGSAPAAERPATLVCASAVGFYGSRGEERLDESTPPGDGFLAEVCEKWEEAASRATPLGTRVVSLRTGIVLSREGGALPLMSLPFRFGLGGRLGSGRQWVPWIHRDDVVSLIRAVLRDDSYSGPVNDVAPHPVRNRDLTAALARVLRRPALIPVPAFAVRAALGELADELLGSRRVVPRAAQGRGFRFAHETLESALEAELR